MSVSGLENTYTCLPYTQGSHTTVNLTLPVHLYVSIGTFVTEKIMYARTHTHMYACMHTHTQTCTCTQHICLYLVAAILSVIVAWVDVACSIKTKPRRVTNLELTVSLHTCIPYLYTKNS